MAIASVIKSLALLAGFAVASAAAATPDAPYYNEHGILQIGTKESLNITVPAGASRDDIISYPDASYLAIHFFSFDLPENDLVIVRSPDASVAYFYSGKGRDESGDFISTFIPGDTAIVQYFSAKDGAPSDVAAYTIAGYSRGFPNKGDESLCGSDNSVPVKCYQTGNTLASSLPQAYERSKTVARLLIGGASLCTGWLAGSEGHLITNQHCITTADDAKTIDIEFMAESSACSVQCKTQLGCKGTVAATTSTFVTNNEEFDYALVKLPASADLSAYNYLQLRGSGPVLNEKIYIPQHPVGYAKRIAAVVDSGAAATISSIHASISCGTNEVGYTADTQGGSSGSPVLAASDNLVVALHHCGGCENSAVDILDVIADLKAKSITVANLVA